MSGLRIAFRSFGHALGSVRVWSLCWLLVTVPAVVLLWPTWVALKKAYDHQPGATVALNQHLDADFARVHADLQIHSAGAGLFMLLAWAFLSGGILCRVGGGRMQASAFFADCGHHLLRNVRALVVGLVLLLLLNWGVDSLDSWLKGEVLADADPGAFAPLGSLRILTLESGLGALDWLYGFLFLALLFAGKLARASLCLQGRRSALLAWLRALLRMLLHPFRTLMVMLGIGAVWLGAAFLLGVAMRWADAEGQTWVLLVLAQVLVVILQLVSIASLLAARELMGALPVWAGAPASETGRGRKGKVVQVTPVAAA